MPIKNNFNLLIVILLIFVAHPAMTEHAEFALSYSKLVDYSILNTFFNVRSSEQSSQIILPAILLKIGVSSGIVQLFMSLICSSIIIASQVLIFKLFLEKINFKIEKNLNYVILILVLLMLFIKPRNISLYPWSPIIYFFEFGNAGLWLTLLVSFYYLNNDKKLTKVLSALLLFWHPVWGAANALFFIIFDYKIIFNKLFIILFFIQLLIIYLFGINFDSSNSNLFLLKKIHDDIFTAHNPVLSSNFFEFFTFIIENIGPIILFIYLLRNDRSNFIKLYNFIFYYLTLSIILLFYIELARYIELPFSHIIFRGIPNRYFDFIHVILILGTIVYILKLDKNNLSTSYIINTSIAFSILLILVGLKSSILIFSICFLTYYIKNAKKYLCILAIILYSIFFYKNNNSTPFNSISEFVSSDPLIIFLTESNDKGGFILSSRVQSYKGLNIGTLSKSQYYVPMKTLVNEIDLYCSNIHSINFNDMNDNSDNCFRTRTANEWKKIGDALNVKYIITNENVILKLDRRFNSRGFNIYEIK
jgi:hypothetical protein